MEVEYKKIYKNLIDIRDLTSFNLFNIPQSINIPKNKLMHNPEKYLNKKDTYYLICEKGKVSLSCTKILNALGYHCFSIKNGIKSIK